MAYYREGFSICTPHVGDVVHLVRVGQCRPATVVTENGLQPLLESGGLVLRATHDSDQRLPETWHYEDHRCGALGRVNVNVPESAVK